MFIPSLLSKHKKCANNSFEIQKMSKILTSLWCLYINTQCVYIGQSSNPYKSYKQHAHMPPYKMKNDVMKYQSFDMHFDLEVMYNTSQRYLASIKERKNSYYQRKKKLIHKNWI